MSGSSIAKGSLESDDLEQPIEDLPSHDPEQVQILPLVRKKKLLCNLSYLNLPTPASRSCGQTPSQGRKRCKFTPLSPASEFSVIYPQFELSD